MILLQAHWKVLYYSICLIEKCYIRTLQANSDVFYGLLDKCTVAVPIFHAYAHNASCQHAFSPGNIEGLGLTDGENVERLFRQNDQRDVIW